MSSRVNFLDSFIPLGHLSFDDENSFDLFSENPQSDTIQTNEEIENQNSQKINYFQDNIRLDLNSDLGDMFVKNLGMDEENMVSPLLTQYFSAHHSQPEIIDIERSGEDLPQAEAVENEIQEQFSRQAQIQQIPQQKIRNLESMEMIHSQISEQNSSEDSQKSKKNLPHLKMDRRRKGERNHLQKDMNGYWTNNLLRWAKKYHLDWIIENLNQKFLKQHPNVFKVFNKVCDKTGKKMEGINMGDYLTIYQEKDLEQCWEKLFSKKFLYRELMLSKADAKVKKVYAKFMRNFERAFRTKKFDFLSRLGSDVPNI